LVGNFFFAAFANALGVFIHPLQRLVVEEPQDGRLTIIAVGPGEALPKLLSGFGEVKEIKLAPEG
jgi:hypothetical protein